MTINNSFCGLGDNPVLETDFSKFSMAAGATASEQLTNCCRTKPTVKCSQVMCASQGVSDRRRSWAHSAWSGAYKAKAGQADVACTGVDDCETKCCEKNPAMCGGVSDSDRNYLVPNWCGTNYSVTPLFAPAAAPGCDPQAVASAAMVATFTASADNATFRSACCTAKPAKPAKTACPADFACPEHYEKKSPMPTALYDSPSHWQCCTQKANVTECWAHCTAGAPYESIHLPPAAGQCGYTSIQTCPSSKCGAGQGLDTNKKIANGATAANATIASTCCVNKPVAATQAATINAKCSAYFAAAAAGAIKAEGTATNSAYMQGASLPVLAVAVLMLMKF